MTKKDYVLIADAIATIEADYKGLYIGVLQDVVDALSSRLKRDNPRFDMNRFKAAALPLYGNDSDGRPTEAEAEAERQALSEAERHWQARVHSAKPFRP